MLNTQLNKSKMDKNSGKIPDIQNKIHLKIVNDKILWWTILLNNVIMQLIERLWVYMNFKKKHIFKKKLFA